MRQVTCAEGQQGAVQYYIDLMVRHKDTVKGFLLMRLQIGKEDGILTIVAAAPKLRGGGDGHGRQGPRRRRGGRGLSEMRLTVPRRAVC